MALVQTRNTRSWNSRIRQFDFSPAEDYLVAAFAVSSGIGARYTPGWVAMQWLDLVHARQVDGAMSPNADAIQVFQCSAKGCNLTTVGLMKLITFHGKSGKSSAEPISITKGSIADGLKYGWRGGAFPPMGRVTRGRSPAVSGRQPVLTG